MAANRLFRMSRPLGLGHRPCNSFSNSCNFSSVSSSSRSTNPRCFSKEGFAEENLPTGLGHKTRKAAEVKASVTSECVLTSEPKTDKGMDLALLLPTLRVVLLSRLNELVTRRRPWKLYLQTFVEKGIVDCRFFTLFAVVGSLLGSLLCYVEGCSLILESYLQYFHALSQQSEQGHLVQLLIEAIDMFLLATSMLVFGMGLYVLFVGSYDLRDKESHEPKPNYLKTLASRVGMNSIMQAKTKIGHAVIMILQVGVLEKFKSIPLVTGFDLACFAGAVFASSACTFLLSKLSIATVADR